LIEFVLMQVLRKSSIYGKNNFAEVLKNSLGTDLKVILFGPSK